MTALYLCSFSSDLMEQDNMGNTTESRILMIFVMDSIFVGLAAVAYHLFLDAYI